MDMGRFLIETHLRTGRPIKELARSHDVSASWLFKLLRRYRLEGPEGLAPRSRRPHRSPSRIADLFEDEIVALHKALAEDGLDAGAATIQHHLVERSGAPPSISTIFRVLKARGFVALSPQKRPKSSFKRFVADLPNECWQADMTHVEFGGGGALRGAQHDRRPLEAVRGLESHAVVKANDVVRVLHKAAESWGYPASFLSDNGLIFSTQRHHQVAGATEQALFAFGIEAKHARPYHPRRAGRSSGSTRRSRSSWPNKTSRAPSSSSASWTASSPTTTRCARTGASGARHQQRSMAHGRRLCPLPRSSRWAIDGCAWTESIKPGGSPFAAGVGSITSGSATPTPAGASPCSSTVSTSRSWASTAHPCAASSSIRPRTTSASPERRPRSRLCPRRRSPMS